VHGLILAGLRAYGVQRLGEEAAERLWAGREYEPTEAYDDEEFAARMRDLERATGDTPDELEQSFGFYTGLTTFAALYPDYYRENTGPLPFLHGIEARIHEVVRATIRGALPPKLHVRELGSDGVLISYTSGRGLCRLLEGLVHGVAHHYGETMVVEQLQCMRHGDPGCVFSVVKAPG
jgi:hypothetical protein